MLIGKCGNQTVLRQEGGRVAFWVYKGGSPGGGQGLPCFLRLCAPAIVKV